MESNADGRSNIEIVHAEFHKTALNQLQSPEINLACVLIEQAIFHYKTQLQSP